MGDIAPREEKEKNMKKLVAFLIILAVVMTGVFAAPGEPENVQGHAVQTGEAYVFLQGSVGPVFQHGVVENGTTFYSKKIIGDALKAEGVEFMYGYKSNQILNAKLYMKYSDFKVENTNKSIQIGQVQINSGTPVYDQSKGFVVFDTLGNTGGSVITSVPVKIVAAQTVTGNDAKNVVVTNAVSNAQDGEYTAILTFEVVNNN